MLSLRFLALPLLCVALVQFSGCAKDADNTTTSPVATDPSPLSDATSVGNLHFDNGLSRKERGAFVTALDYLDHSEITNADPALLEMMQIPSFDRFTLHQWLEDRIQYIVPSNVNLDVKIPILQKNFTGYENPGAIPQIFLDAQNPGNHLADASAGKVVMSNIGVTIYLTGKLHSWLLALDIDGVGRVPFSSPRTGMLKIGEGLFLMPAKYSNLVKIFQLTTLLHESRHSDGNGTGTGFLHDKCPDGDYAGQAACDHYTNGAYEIQTLALGEFLNACSDCSVIEREELKLLIIDMDKRQIRDSGTATLDPRPEGHR